MFGQFLKNTVTNNLPSNINTSEIRRKLENTTADLESQVSGLQGEAVAFANNTKEQIVSSIDVGAIQSSAKTALNSAKKAITGKLSEVTKQLPVGPAGAGLADLGGNSLGGLNEFGAYVYYGKNASPDSGGTKIHKFGGEGGIANEDPRHPNLLPNILNDFVSVNYVITLGVLDIQEVNYPDQTYIKNGPKTIIIKSGGGKPNPGQTMTSTASEDNTGDTEFFIDDLEIESVMTPNSKTSTTTTGKFSFNVMEPYSMGQYMEALHVASLGAGYTHFTEATFVLIIDFIGWDKNGNAKRMSDFSDTSVSGPAGKPVTYQHSRRYIPVTLTQAEFSVNGGGCIYECTAISQNDQGLNDSVQFLPADLTISGESVHELLQTGEKSLTSAINNHLLEAKTENPIQYADQFIILFPKEDARASSELKLDNSASGEGASDHTKGYGQTNLKNISGEDMVASLLKNVEDDKRNQIGTSAVILDKLLDMNQVYKNRDKKTHKEKDVLIEANVALINKKAFTFSQGTRISSIIEEIVLSSKWAQANGPLGQSDRYGNVNWFKVECKVYNVPVKDATNQRGVMPKIFVYSVVTYKQHSSVWSKATVPKGTEEIRSIVCKKYDYIYTGQNKDIINFDIAYKFRFLSKLQSDLGNDSKNQQATGGDATVARAQDSHTETKKAEGATKITTDTTKVTPELHFVKKISENTQTVNYTPSTRAVPSSQKQEIARMFHDQTINFVGDMTVVELEIYGDPYFISDSGHGNYNSRFVKDAMVDNRGMISYQTTRPYIVVEFRTPVDLGSDGIMKWPKYHRTNKLVSHFSGIFYITMINHSFSKGLFKQKLSIIRQFEQKVTPDGSPDSNNTSLVEFDANKKGDGGGDTKAIISGDSSNSSSDSGGTSLAPQFSLAGQSNPSVATGGFNTRRA